VSVALQGPGEDLDYSHDWSPDLDDQGSPSDTISSATWTLEGPDDGGSPSPQTHTPTTSGNVVSAWVSDLQLGGVYRLRHVMTSDAGRRFEHDWVIRCGYR
jgi:hypothetical protein